MGALALGAALPAQAAPGHDGPGLDLAGVTAYGTVWLGAVTGTAEAQATSFLSWCITAGYDAPQGVSTTGISYVSDPDLSWIIAAYESVATDLSRAAISYLMHIRHETGTATVSAAARIAAYQANTPQAVKDQANAYLAAAASQSGPYVAATGQPQTVDRRTGTINNIGVQTDAGTWIAGKPFTVTLQGPAVFDLNGNGVEDAGETNVYSGTTEGHGLSLPWVATGNGTVTPVVQIRSLARVTLTKFGAAGQVQDTLSYGHRAPSDPEEISAPGTQFDVVKDFQPEITTRVSTVFVDKGASLIDEVTVAAQVGDTWSQVGGSYVPVTATGVLYGPFDSQPAQSATVPTGAPVAATDIVTFTGPATKPSTADLKATGSGYYTWVWKITKSAQPTAYEPYIRADATHDFGLVAETHIVPFQPELTTVVRDRVVEFGETFVDEVTFAPASGDVWLSKTDGAPVDVTAFGTLYGPFDVPTVEVSDIPHDAPIAGRDMLTVSGPVKEVTRTPNMPWEAGFYTWVWEIQYEQQPVESQPYLSGSFATAFMIESETATVKHTTAFSTMTREYNVVIGGQAQDVITVAGLPDSHGDFEGVGGWVADVDEITHTLYGPFTIAPTHGTDLTTAPVVNSVKTPARNGQYLIGSSGQFTLWEQGYYVFVSDFVGDNRVNAFTTSPGDLLEQVYVPGDEVGPPGTWLVTEADREVVAGQPFQDSAHLTGTIVEGGYLVFEAYGPFPVDVDEAPVQSSSTLLWTSRDIPVHGVGTYLSGSTTADLPEGLDFGEAYWVATYYDASGTVVTAGRFGDESEITRLLAPRAPAVTTLAVEQATLVDGAHDTAFVSGPIEPGSMLTWQVYRQIDSDDLADDELVAEVGPVVIYHGGHYDSPEVIFDDAGTYYWVETLSDPDGRVLHVGEPRLPNETTTVAPEPLPLVRTLATDQVMLGEPARDVAMVSGPVKPESVLSWQAYRQAQSDDDDDDELVAEVGPVVIYHGGHYNSPEVIFDDVGTYYWVETLTDPDGQILHVGEPRLPNETTTVLPDEAHESDAAASGDQASASGSLAVTGLRNVGLLFALATATAVVGGSLLRWSERRRTAAARR